jgi:hypothetical protein
VDDLCATYCYEIEKALYGLEFVGGMKEPKKSTTSKAFIKRVLIEYGGGLLDCERRLVKQLSIFKSGVTVPNSRLMPHLLHFTEQKWTN